MSEHSVAGKRARISIGTKGALLSTGDLTNGTYYIISAKGETSALPEQIPVNRIFSPSAVAGITLGAGDAVYPVSFSVLCVAKDKSVSYAKGEIDATTDCDDVMDYISNELPEQSFTFAGNNALDPTILKKLESQFDVVITDDGAGVYTFTDLDHSTIWFKIDYSEGNRATGDNIKAKIAPAIITSLDVNAPLNGIQDFSINGRFKSADEDGHRGAVYYGVQLAPAE